MVSLSFLSLTLSVLNIFNVTQGFQLKLPHETHQNRQQKDKKKGITCPFLASDFATVLVT
jgi:hypothetical protein